MRSLKMIFAAARRLAREWRVMAVMSAVYAMLLAALFLFVATTEATAWQIMLTLCFAALAPVFFFLLQALIVNYTRGETQTTRLLRRSFSDSCKLALMSLPLAFLGLLFLYILNKLQFPSPTWTAPTTPPGVWHVHPPQANVATPSLPWSQLAWTTVRFLFCYVALPLAAIHLWSAVLRDGLLPAIKRAPHHAASAFSTDAVLTYAVGLLLFGLVPYVLLFRQTPAARPSVEFGLFIARLLLAFVFTLYGWVLTLDALAGAGNVAAANAGATMSAQPAID